MLPPVIHNPQNVECTFRPLQADEVNEAYAAYLEVCAWLQRRQIRLWLQPLPPEKFKERQVRGELFGLFAGRELAVSLTLLNETPAYWQDELGTEPIWWLSTVATSVKFKGRGLGERAVAQATTWLARKGATEVLLDCALGFLPRFYQRCGFSALIEKDVTFSSGNTYPLVLMKKDIAAVAVAEEVKNSVA